MHRAAGRHSAARRLLVRLAPAAWCTSLYLLLRPENFGLTPNALDPFFYSGYTVNLDDALRATGIRWYFISRWSAYLPAHYFTVIAGPFLGRLLFRLVLTTAAVVLLRSLGRASRWRWEQTLLASTVLITMPMFVRALFTDYTEHAVVGYGVLLVCLCLRPRQTIWTTTALGVLSGLLLVANPTSLSMIAAPLTAAIVVGVRTYKSRAAFAVAIGSLAGVTILLGAWYFSWRFGVAHIYRPTIHFMENGPGRDPLKSPRLDWLGRFTWIYGPPIVLAAAAAVLCIRKQRPSAMEWSIAGIVLAQYIYQIVDQFLRDSDGLEISYYWSNMYPSFGVLLALVIARMAEGASRRRLIALLIGWLLLLKVGIPDALLLPVGLGFMFLAVLVVALIAVTARASMTAAGAVLGCFVLWTQIGAPPYDPTAYHPYNMSPRYDKLYT
ncbi:MAG: hypothetical protein WCJ42_12595, partial [Actinomycetes bacterium]